MRRNALGLNLVLTFAGSALLAQGCGMSRPYRNIGVGRPDPSVRRASVESGGETSDARGARFSRDAVPDSVMLRDQIDTGYRDTPAPPF